MCGRLGSANKDDIRDLFPEAINPDLFDEFPRRYNVGPKQNVPVVAERSGELVVQEMNWWLVPHWSRDGQVKATTFIARSESVDSSRLFASYFRSSRAIIPAPFFYEWMKVEKRPFLFRRSDGTPFALAGIFSVWKDAEGLEKPTFSILTTDANELMKPIHFRMPVILDPEHFDMWLDRTFKDIDALKTLLKPCDPDKMTSLEVSMYVNSVRNEGPGCIEPVAES